MLWFIIASTLLLAAAALLPGTPWRRHGIEMSVALVILLPVLRWGVEWLAWPPLPFLEKSVPSREPSTVEGLLVTLWLLGAAGNLARVARQAVLVHRLCRGARPFPDNTCGFIAASLTLDPATVRRRFRRTNACKLPLVLPTLPALVLLPEDWRNWTPRLKVGVLKHEWHHATHGDALWHAAMHLFCCFLWFHPLAWWLAARWADDCEIQADRAAVGLLDPVDYASDLLGLAQPQSRSPGSALGFASGKKSRLMRRIEALFRPPLPAAGKVEGVSPFALVTLVVLAVGCAWMGVRRGAETKLIQETHMRLSAEAFPADR